MDRKTSSLGEYLWWILSKYREVQQEAQLNAKYRVLKIIRTPDDTLSLRIQIIGTAKILHWSPQQIVTDDQILEGFSKKDIRTITYYACEELKKPKCKVMSHSFSNKLNKIIFLIKKLGSSKFIEKTAADISSDKEMINQLTPEDAHRVGYLCGSEAVDEEKEMLKKITG